MDIGALPIAFFFLRREGARCAHFTKHYTQFYCIIARGAPQGFFRHDSRFFSGGNRSFKLAVRPAPPAREMSGRKARRGRPVFVPAARGAPCEFLHYQ